MFASLNCHQISTSAALFGLFTEHSKWARLPSSATSVLSNWSDSDDVSMADDVAARRRRVAAGEKRGEDIHYSDCRPRSTDRQESYVMLGKTTASCDQHDGSFATAMLSEKEGWLGNVKAFRARESGGDPIASRTGLLHATDDPLNSCGDTHQLTG